MAELNLEWIEAGRLNTKRIVSNPINQQSEITRVGRDPSRCNIVLTDGSVSGLHVEIGFDPSSQSFYVQNLRESNPPIVNNQPLVTGRVLLQAENTIQLGNVQLRAIAIHDSQALPATDIQVPSAASPIAPTISSNSGGISASSSPPAQPPTQSPFNRANNYDYATAQSVGSDQSSKSRWLIVGFIGLLLVLVAMAWPNVSGFLGIGRGRVVSESNMPSDESADDEPSGDASNSPEESQLSMANLEPYAHPTGLFELEVPENWEFLDNSQPGDIVIQGWRHPQLNSYVIVRIFEADQELRRPQLQNFGINVVEDLFGDLEEFQRGEPKPLLDRSVRVEWEASDGPDTLLASTFVRQDGLNLSALTVWAPQGHVDFDALQEDIDLIVASYEVDSGVNIP